MLRLKYFTPENFAFVMACYDNPEYTLKRIAKELDCTPKTLQSAIEKLGLKRNLKVPTWKIDYMLKNYSQPILLETMAQHLGMTEWHVYELAKQLKLRRPPSHVMKKLCKLNGNPNKKAEPRVIVEDLGFGCTRRINVVFHEKRV
jgi:AraC-like DNA-binding protein